MVATLKRADRVLLHNISWEQYKGFLKDFGDRPLARIAYDSGTLVTISLSNRFNSLGDSRSSH
jgi:hypothetical protein